MKKVTFSSHPNANIKVSTHEGTSPFDKSLQLVPWWVYMKGLVTGTCPMNSSGKAFWETSCRDLSQKFKLVWIGGTSCRDQSLVPVKQKWPVHWMGLVPVTCFEWLVMGTSPVFSHLFHLGPSRAQIFWLLSFNTCNLLKL